MDNEINLNPHHLKGKQTTRLTFLIYGKFRAANSEIICLLNDTHNDGS